MNDDPKDDPKTSGGERPWWQEAMREASLTGLAALFMTEDSIRKYLREKKLPTELVGLFLEGIGRKKDDFYGLFAKEFGRVLGKVDLTREMGKFLERHKIHVNATLTFERRGGTEQAAAQDEGEGK